LVIALDPGHQLGNSNPRFASEIAKTRFNGHMTKGCNTTGTATNGGFPEATFNWRVTRYLENRLVALGATVRKTRSSNSYDAWGPCVWDRGRFGAAVGADLLLSIHADGAGPSGSGFYIMLPTSITGWTDDIARPSARMGKRFIQAMADAGAPRSTYIAGQTLVTPEISTLNFSDVPAILVELGNMRNSSDAARMASREGQKQYADWLVAGLRAALKA
jgi:N-acetylmuramoyl-L-alanine amidase